ncbi:MAG: acetyltransferase [Ignavibacteria bacterium GWF2_33_9]|nr:MAG: acetyltransferase [Ignavibacteria bacterium GWF2_33_9]
MLFNSYEFLLIFLPVTFFIYFFLNKIKLLQLSKGWLVLASLFFYSYWNIKYLPLILCSMLFNYSIGTTLNNPEATKLKINRKAILTFGITCNLLLLGYYKYFDFFITNINIAFNGNYNLLHIILPLGISFFTFTQIAYLVDAYKQEVKEADFLNYALFVTYFPHLIAGPILHHSEMMPQFSKLRAKIINHKNISIGLALLTIGLFKKIIIADNLAPIVHQGFDVSTTLAFFEAWITSLSYTFQLYFDFSGYTDMALGLSMMFNIKLPENFNSPYKAQNIQDFWRRWHMTLSRFLKDYVYIPFGGNRFGEFKTYSNLFITFLLGGIWHGAAWTFVLWGSLHGLALVIHRFWQKSRIQVNKIISIAATFLFVNITWVFFRALNFEDAQKVLNGMFGLSGFVLPRINKFLLKFPGDIQINWLMILIIFIIVFGFKNSSEMAKDFKPSILYLVIFIALSYFSLINISQISEFLYFQF